jgi:hypothetical protein
MDGCWGLLQYRPSAVLMEKSATEVVRNIYGGHSYQSPPSEQKKASMLSRILTIRSLSPTTESTASIISPTSPSGDALSEATLASHRLDFMEAEDALEDSDPKDSTRLNPAFATLWPDPH